jgi:hypothetical protein
VLQKNEMKLVVPPTPGGDPYWQLLAASENGRLALWRRRLPGAKVSDSATEHRHDEIVASCSERGEGLPLKYRNGWAACFMGPKADCAVLTSEAGAERLLLYDDSGQLRQTLAMPSQELGPPVEIAHRSSSWRAFLRIGKAGVAGEAVVYNLQTRECSLEQRVDAVDAGAAEIIDDVLYWNSGRRVSSLDLRSRNRSAIFPRDAVGLAVRCSPSIAF